MTPEQYTSKEKELTERRKQLKHHVIYNDSATKINNLKQLIENLENELKSHKNNS